MSNYVSLRRDISNNFQEQDVCNASHSKFLNMAMSTVGAVSMWLAGVGMLGYARGLSNS